jgi:DNA-binding NtrC family response regulator
MRINKNYKIFIVDDDPIYTEFISSILNRRGYQNVSSQLTEEELFENLYQHPDVIFLDYYLDENNGLDVLKKIKSINPDIHVIFLSGQGKIEVAVNSLKYGALDYIIKNDETPTRILKSMNRIMNIDSRKKSILNQLKEQFLFLNLLF